MIIQGKRCGIKGVRGGFTRACKGWILLGAVFGALCLSPAPAAADFIVGFDLNLAKLHHTVVYAEDGTTVLSRVLTVIENIYSDLLVTYEDDSISKVEDGSNILDGAKIVGGANFDLNFSLTMVKDSGTGLWSANGTFAFTDTVLGSNAVEGNFESTNVEIYPGEVLWITGDLSNDVLLTPILQNRGAMRRA